MDIREWENRYYNEADKVKRKALLEERIAEGEESPDLELMKKLFNARYKPEPKEPENIDHMLRGIVELKYATPGNGLFSRPPKKLIPKILSDLGADIVEPYGEAGRRIWYLELKHLGKTYLSICAEDRAYSSYFWGLGRMSNPALQAKLSRDIQRVAHTNPEYLGIEKELQLFSAAVTDAFNEVFSKPKESFYFD